MVAQARGEQVRIPDLRNGAGRDIHFRRGGPGVPGSAGYAGRRPTRSAFPLLVNQMPARYRQTESRSRKVPFSPPTRSTNLRFADRLASALAQPAREPSEPRLIVADQPIAARSNLFRTNQGLIQTRSGGTGQKPEALLVAAGEQEDIRPFFA